MVTFRPRASRIAANEADAIPLPSDDTTPPVTKIKRVMQIPSICQTQVNCNQKATHRGGCCLQLWATLNLTWKKGRLSSQIGAAEYQKGRGRSNTKRALPTGSAPRPLIPTQISRQTTAPPLTTMILAKFKVRQVMRIQQMAAPLTGHEHQIGRASCRE